MNDGAGALTPFQIEVARVFFTLPSSTGFVVTGGAALLASHLIVRPTMDLDLFTSGRDASVSEAQRDLVDAMNAAACEVSVLTSTTEFCRLLLARGAESLVVDLAIDSPPATRPASTVLGPTLAPLELAGRKLLALFGRAEARDFADVYLLCQRFTPDVILAQAESQDAGFDRRVLAQMMGTLDRFDPEEIPLTQEEQADAVKFFARWRNDLQG